jgi:hypothetical protein
MGHQSPSSHTHTLSEVREIGVSFNRELPTGCAEVLCRQTPRRAADRTSCTRATANQLRLFLHAGAYWIMWGLRVSMPKKSMWRVAQFDTPPVPRQNRRARRRDENNDPRAVADIVSRATDFALRAGANPAPRHVTGGPRRPGHPTIPVNPQTLSNPHAGSPPVTKRRVREAAKAQSSHAKTTV